MPEIDMPRMSDTMEEGRIVRWLKKVGDRVEKDEVLAEVETDKAVMEMPSYLAGTLEQILLPEGDSAPIGTPIAVIGSGAAPRPAVEPRQPAAKAPASVGETAAPAPAEAPAPAAAEPRLDGERVKASPIARRIAEEAGVDLARVDGSGPGGRIVREDVERYLVQASQAPAAPKPARPTVPPVAAPQPAPTQPAQPVAPRSTESDQVIELSRMRRTIGERMAESKWPVPHFYITSEIDMGEAMALRKRLNEAWAPDSVGVNDLIVRASAIALRKFPSVNSSYQPAKDGQPPKVIQRARVNIGIAVAAPNEGLFVPVVHDADQKGLRDISRVTKGLVERSRAEKPGPSDFGGGTFSISNLGMYDVDEFIAVINPPEAAILAIGSIKPTPVVVDGEVKVAQRMKMTISADHRVFSGETAARFLQELKRLLQNPFDLLQ